MIKMNDNLLKIGIIGCGRMGEIRAASSKLNGSVVFAIYDPDTNRAMSLKEKYPEAEVVENFEELPWTKLNAVFICSPPKYHLSYATAALNENTPFLMEKPLGLHANEFIPLIERVEKKGLINAVGYMNRYRLSVESLKKKILTTPPLGIVSYWVNNKYYVPWWSNLKESGGPLNEQATHLVDLNRYILGEIGALKTFAKTDDDGLIISASVNFCFHNNCLGNIFYSCNATSKQIGLKVFTNEGEISLEGWDFKLESSDSGGEEDKNLIFQRETFYFLKAVKEKNQSLIRCDIVEALKTQKVVDAIHESS